MSFLRIICCMCYSMRGGFFVLFLQDCVSAFPTHLFYLLLWRVLHLALRYFSEGNDLYGAIDLVCPWEENLPTLSSWTPLPLFITYSNSMVLLPTYIICRLLRKILAHENRKVCVTQAECWGRKTNYKFQKVYLKFEKNLSSIIELFTQ